ncbi:hypothetical protein K2173_000979 [Erythroxylum novogranatense]|uniref:Amidase domain-containing protein n=1 Tax=Erythroxylum novogranatense TaxID=1862640 RepID=A0AAV8TT04_9ROSI|nr:hypothetical protein K2173_000979 [Erythroxylum novogranatense]
MGLFQDKGIVYKPADEVDVGPDSHESYLQANVKAPRMAGLLVKICVWLMELKILGTFLMYMLKRNNLFYKLVINAEMAESPLFVPLNSFQELNEQEVQLTSTDSSPPERVQAAIDCLSSPSKTVPNGLESSFRHWKIMDYHTSYSSGETTPSTVAERLITAIKESSSPPLDMNFFIDSNSKDILRQAAESTSRYQKGKPISALDGVPVAVKDEIDCTPYPTTGGTKWLHRIRPCKADACCIKRLKQCGAIIIGKTNMHELGAGISGINPHYGVARNPYDSGKITGGSSSGSAAAVAAGLCPVALGVDGGGSVRLPAALCGVVGFKPTFGRIPHSGVLPLNWTIGMIGILAGSIEDAFIVYAAINGQMSSDENPILQPKLYLPLLKSINRISGIRLARYGEWFNDCRDDIRICCADALDQLRQNYGWQIVEVTIPDIEAMRLAHYVTIASECTTSLDPYMEKIDKSESGWDVRLGLRVYGSMSAKAYVQAQKFRNRQMQLHKKIFERADVIVTPTTGVTAYPIFNDALDTGELDYINGAALVRFQIAGNFLGLPAVTVPVGYDKTGMPIGLQFIGRPWSEPTLIHLAYAMQALRISGFRKPQVYYDLLRNGRL